MKITEQLPNTVNWQQFDDRDSQTNALAQHIAKKLSAAVESKGSATLAVSGGRTPVALFNALSAMELPWSSISITLIDDRWVPEDHKDSNEGMLKRELLKGYAQEAKFIGLYSDSDSAETSAKEANEKLKAASFPLDVAILGMGNDGHTASLFPCSAELQNGLTSTETCVATTPTTAPHQRVTMTLPTIMAAGERILHLCGDDKLDTLSSALEDADNISGMPVRALFKDSLSIYWAS